MTAFVYATPRVGAFWSDCHVTARTNGKALAAHRRALTGTC